MDNIVGTTSEIIGASGRPEPMNEVLDMRASPQFPMTLLRSPPDVCGPTRSTADDLARKRYAAAGDRSYVIGMLDGSFPPIGTRITSAGPLSSVLTPNVSRPPREKADKVSRIAVVKPCSSW